MVSAGCNDVAAVPAKLDADARGFARLRGGALWRGEWRRYATLAAVSVLGAGAFGVLRRIDPNVAGNPLPPCPLQALTGLYCPGCGSTRCLHALAHLDLAGAMAMNPLLVLSLLPLAVLVLHGAGLLPQRLQGLAEPLANPRLWLVLLLGFAFLRNLPWAPFTLLAPG